nr:signal recognition particle receptor subunit alpha [Quercus suber]
MLDAFEILTTSGIVLWRKQYAPLSSNVINSLINDVFIEERGKSAQDGGSSTSYKKDRYTLKWTNAKDLGLVFVVGKSLAFYNVRLMPLLTGNAGSLPKLASSVLGG